MEPKQEEVKLKDVPKKSEEIVVIEEQMEIQQINIEGPMGSITEPKLKPEIKPSLTPELEPKIVHKVELEEKPDERKETKEEQVQKAEEFEFDDDEFLDVPSEEPSRSVLHRPEEFVDLEQCSSSAMAKVLEALEEIDCGNHSRHIDFDDLYEYSHKDFFEKTDIFIIGQYKYANGKHYVYEIDNIFHEDDPHKLLLEMSNVTEFPILGHFIEVWGTLEKKDYMYLDVWFYQDWGDCKTPIKKYLEELSEVKEIF